MIRIVVENVLLFLLPAAMYMGYVLLTRRTTSAGTVINEAPLVWLFIAGAVLVVGTVFYYASTGEGGRPDQTYTPPRVKDGRIEPGVLK
jgi:predicted membrane channel-forming protein YqfA (hemolysin III family)